MNYGEILDIFAKTLKRNMTPPSLYKAWVEQSIQNAQRLIVVPAAEGLLHFDVGPAFNGLDIPPDYLRLISLQVDGKEVRRSDVTTVKSLSQTVGVPRYFVREGAQFLIGPKPSEHSVITINYGRNFSNLVNPTDSNWLTDIGSDIILAGAMVNACRYYLDQRLNLFQEQFVKGIGDLNMQALYDELSNAQLGGAYSFAFDDHD